MLNKSSNMQSCLNCEHRLYLTKYCLLKGEDVNLYENCPNWELHSCIIGSEELWEKYGFIYRNYGIRYDPQRGFGKY